MLKVGRVPSVPQRVHVGTKYTQWGQGKAYNCNIIELKYFCNIIICHNASIFVWILHWICIEFRLNSEMKAK